MKLSRYLLVGMVLTSSFLAVPTASAATGWQVDLAEPAAGSTNVETGPVRLGSDDNRAASADSAARTGMAVYPHTLATAANAFTATVTSTVPDGAEVAVDVRGRAAGRWTEWAEIRPGAPGVLTGAAKDVEVRVVLSAPDGVASPTVDALTITPAAGQRAPAPQPGLTYRVFATREGLVGHTTANGHKIVARDHFVALPSRRGLSAKGAGDYSVRVCAANGRCEWAPTWDVGPWNTRDDYWAAPEVRQQWGDLPQGKPASQAAYEDGYNGGKDQFGRKVKNPAGIDLADGTFWDGLKLKNNAWVTVTYQWTGTHPHGFVDTPGPVLNVRPGPNSQSPNVGLAAKHAQVRIECVVAGEQVTGSQGTTNQWYRLAEGMFVSAAHVAYGPGASPVPTC
ncbi:hypothetical protein [Actinophytocola algeriensis]|uniref:SH3 domain-containing protein n=1 Tax=Actinophytocola algeriensis TaxID=1768010 RepID=A0A7W7QE39_9PSEU|nr:hypothetical protein [Actinophytocola algeriensis]MBB4911853.1 hypothetical protein [Actinophytocola algeriensis]MBE1477655.1 hypothetical protein [Actinophytocola algeriensis]